MANDDLDNITYEEALAALQDPVNGSLRVLKALGKLRDGYRDQLKNGEIRLEAANDLERAAAEAALDDFAQEAMEDGEKVPRISIIRPKVFQWK
ncbi:MAG: hypothetical protein LBT38_09910 [Deltaproteobacteria bacterium]|jgi:hypothetical protein|nr:hypothetical protein [Deltaproteobacteria bacterium]